MYSKVMEKLIGHGTVILTIVIGILLIKIIAVITKRALKKSKMDPTVYKFILNGVRIVAILVLIVVVLELMGIKTTSFLTVMGVAGAAIAFALKESLGNVAGGILILVTNPFNHNDDIQVNDFRGQVLSTDLFTTTLKTYDNKIITVPNGLITSSILINYTRENNRRVDCIFGIGYGDDTEEARGIILDSIGKNSYIFKDPKPFIGVGSNREGVVDMEVKVWCKTEKFWDVKYYLEEDIKKSLKLAGISTPVPKMDINIVSG